MNTRGRWATLMLGILATQPLSGCTRSTLVHEQHATGWGGERPVLIDPAASAIDSSYEVHAHSVTGQLLWSAQCVTERSQEHVDETREETGPHRGAGAAWLIAGGLGMAATGATFVASSQASGPTECTLPNGQTTECSNERGTLLAAGVGLAVLSAAALATGSTTFLQDPSSHVVDRTTTEKVERGDAHVACGTTRDLAGAEVALIRPGLPEARAFVDETGGFVIELDDGSTAPRFDVEGSLVLVYAPVTMSSLVQTPRVLAQFHNLTPGTP